MKSDPKNRLNLLFAIIFHIIIDIHCQSIINGVRLAAPLEPGVRKEDVRRTVGSPLGFI